MTTSTVSRCALRRSKAKAGQKSVSVLIQRGGHLNWTLAKAQHGISNKYLHGLCSIIPVSAVNLSHLSIRSISFVKLRIVLSVAFKWTQTTQGVHDYIPRPDSWKTTLTSKPCLHLKSNHRGAFMSYQPLLVGSTKSHQSFISAQVKQHETKRGKTNREGAQPPPLLCVQLIYLQPYTTLSCVPVSYQGDCEGHRVS